MIQSHTVELAVSTCTLCGQARQDWQVTVNGLKNALHTYDCPDITVYS